MTTTENSVGSDLFDFTKAKPRLDALISSWSTLQEQAKKNRDVRYVNLDVSKMRASGELMPNETMIPIRVVDSNIEKTKSDAMAFLNSSHRLAYLRCVNDPLQDTRQLETDLTKGLTYEGWYNAFDAHYDGAALHGWDCIEVVYDESKPLHVGFEHVGFDNLIFNNKVSDIQDSPVVIRRYPNITASVLEDMKAFGFSPEVVDSLLARRADKFKDDAVFTVYKVLFKVKRCVYVAWYSKDNESRDWLRAPEMYFVGIKSPLSTPQISIGADVMQQTSNATNSEFSSLPNVQSSQAPIEPIDIYPIFMWMYKADEQAEIVNHKGRGFLDFPMQEASTALASGFVNSVVKGSGVYTCPAKENDESTNKRLEEVSIEPDTMLPGPVTFFSPPMPDSSVLQALQYLDVTNSRQTGKIATAVSNRKDARKTAEELSQAKAEEQKATAAYLATYSEFLRQLYSFSWRIVQSQALAGDIVFCPKRVPTDPNSVIPQPETWTNDIETIAKDYDIRPAGEVDVVQRNQKMADFQQDWPVLQNTPIAQLFLEDYIRLRYPLDADKYIAALKAGNPAKALVQSLLTTLQGALQPEEIQALGPEGQQKLQGIVTQAQQFLASPAL